MGNSEEFAFMDATAQAELVKKKEVKPVELVEAAIERIEKINPELNAVITPMYDIARDAAKGDIPDGPFTGVPFLLKDLIAEYKGVRLTAGSNFLGEYISEKDTELVKRYKQAGVIVVGKTNTPEFGILPTTEPGRFGASRNPWNTGHTTGGSSGGTAAAVSSGMVPMAHGNDGGGSIRIPSSCCGLFGIKPTRGRNPLGPDFGDIYAGLVCEHVLTRSVRDSAAMLDATSGPDLGDPYIAPQPTRPYIQEVGAEVGKLRIGHTTKSFVGAPVHEECVKSVSEAIKVCEELGHNVEELKMDISGELATQAFLTLWSAGCAWDMENWSKKLGKKAAEDQFEYLTWAHAGIGRTHSGTTILNAMRDLQLLSRQIAAAFADYDVVITPTLAEPPVKLGTFDSPKNNPMFGLVRAASFAAFTPICNITGQPAMSVPLHWSKDGLPIGTHIIGKYGDEATLFRLAAQIEQAHPWAEKRPLVNAGGRWG